MLNDITMLATNLARLAQQPANLISHFDVKNGSPAIAIT